MRKLSGAGPGPLRGALTALAAVAVTGLAACGTVTAGRGAPPAASSRSSGAAPSSAAAPGAGAGSRDASGAALCAARDRVDRVVVTVIAGLSAGRPPAARPAGITIADAARVRALASALCALPAPPPGVVNCPADFGGAYTMVFSAEGRRFPAVTAQIGGCRTVAGLGRARVAGEAFWRVLAAALGGRLHGANPGGAARP